MSEQKQEEAPQAPSGSKLPLILLLVNTLVILVAMGMLVYTRVLFKRPSITEAGERKRLAEAAAKPSVPTESGSVAFEPVTVNIVPSGAKSQYASIGFSLQIRDKTRSQDVESVRALLMDRFLEIVGRKRFRDLDNVQGRYLLRTELIDAFNKLIFEKAGSIQAPPMAAKPASEGGHGGHGAPDAHAAHEENQAPRPPIKDLVTNVYFSQFSVQ